jgi:hypothetical protein
MKKLFFTGLLGLIFFEIANVYFIMPMPGSQQMDSIDLAYFLYTWRWAFRILFLIVLIAGLAKSKWKKRWVPAVLLLAMIVIIYMFNFVMSADHMFLQPTQLLMKPAAENETDTARLVMGVVHNNEAKAYPVQYLGYHHHVQDSIGGKPILVTYCTVCRTGRIYEPVVNGKHEQFRLVGMDHFNAMIEDKSTKSWWRQSTGEAITGKLKGAQLPEVLFTQTSLDQWLKLYPSSLIMQADPVFKDSYDSTMEYESGASRKKLTGTDSLSWKKKSWVVGVRHNGQAKAYDWNQLMQQRIIYDQVGSDSIIVVVAQDGKSFFAFVQPKAQTLSLKQDTLFSNGVRYRINGIGIDTVAALKQVKAFQEFWHSWKEFQPETLRY